MLDRYQILTNIWINVTLYIENPIVTELLEILRILHFFVP